MELGNLNSIIQVSFAICLAYLGLDRFRYSNIVLARIKQAREKAETILKHAYPQGKNNQNNVLVRQDTALTGLRDHELEVSHDGIYIKFIGLKLRYSTKDKVGADTSITFILLIIQVLMLVTIAHSPKHSAPICFYSTLLATLVGGIIPIIFVYKGVIRCNTVDEYVETQLSAMRKTYRNLIQSQKQNLK